MAMVTVFPFRLWERIASGSRWTVQANAVGEGAAWIFPIPLTGTVTHLVFCTGTVTTNVTADGKIGGVGTNGLPDGVAITNGTGTLAIVATTDNNKILELPINGGTGASVTKGILQACSITAPATPGDCNYAYAAIDQGYESFGTPYVCTNTGAWAKSGAAQGIFALRYATTGLVPIPGYMGPNTSAPGIGAWASTASPDEYGNSFVAPAAMRCWGAEAVIVSGTGDYRITLRNTSGTLLASSPTIEGDAQYAAQLTKRIPFTTSYSLVAGTRYDLCIEAMTATAACGLWSHIVSANSYLAAYPGGVDTYRVNYVDGAGRGTTTTEVLSISPLIDQIDDGAGAGGSTTVLNSRATAHLRR